MKERCRLIEAQHPLLSIRRQNALLAANRSSFYYRPKGESAENQALMRKMDELSYAMQTSVSQMSVILLSLEFKGLILSLPGKMYVLS